LALDAKLGILLSNSSLAEVKYGLYYKTGQKGKILNTLKIKKPE
jgi:hypothetical protein